MLMVKEAAQSVYIPSEGGGRSLPRPGHAGSVAVTHGENTFFWTGVMLSMLR